MLGLSTQISLGNWGLEMDGLKSWETVVCKHLLMHYRDPSSHPPGNQCIIANKANNDAYVCVTCNGAHTRPRGAGTLVADAARPDSMGGAHCMAIHGPSSQVIPAYLPVMELKSHSVRLFTLTVLSAAAAAAAAAAHHSQDRDSSGRCMAEWDRT